jgi:hypothetical protein
MPHGAHQLTTDEAALVVEALEDAMFFRDARSRIPKMAAETKRRDRDRVAAYEALAARLKQAPSR